MEPLVVFIVATSKNSGLFEQVVSHAVDDVQIITALDETDVRRVLVETHAHCVVVDWEVDFIAPDLFPRFLQRVQTDIPQLIVAIVHNPDQLHAALSAGYDFAIKQEFSRTTYHTIRSILAWLQKHIQLDAQLKATEQERANLRATAEHVVQLVERIQAWRIPEYTAVAHFARDAARWILDRMQPALGGTFTDPLALDMAARLYAVGRIVLGAEHLHAPIHRDGVPTSAVAATVPTIAAELLEPLVEYPETRLILLTMYENFDGTGFPNRSQGWHIPLGARVLRVVVDFAELVFRDGESMLDALSIIEQGSHRIYDHRVVLLLGELVAQRQHEEQDSQLLALRVESLSPGLRLGRDVITTSGHKLASRGTELTATHIERILVHHANDPIIGKVYVYRD
ncbi:MAG: hypothetical protein KatS3mg039_0740 [Candidatus Kapaibacterium sp.]|nr:MAG: hypothetical protein KatS3mg039_0740 [Candidatus Kapabacteria bacterium]